MKRLLIILAILVAQSIPAVAESREKDLDRWVDRDLIPYVRQQLVMHPRFSNETVMFVVLDDNAPSSSTNALPETNEPSPGSVTPPRNSTMASPLMMTVSVQPVAGSRSLPLSVFCIGLRIPPAVRTLT